MTYTAELVCPSRTARGESFQNENIGFRSWVILPQVSLIPLQDVLVNFFGNTQKHPETHKFSGTLT
jgi:hypothetical protein